MPRISIFALLTFFSTFLMGCFPEEVSREQVGQPEQIQVEQSCHYTGICYKCNLSMECGFKMSNRCDGKRDTVVLRTRIRILYDDDSSKLINSDETLSHGQCKG